MKLPLRFLLEECAGECSFSDEGTLRNKWVNDVRLLGVDETLQRDVLYVDLGQGEVPENSSTLILTTIREMDRFSGKCHWVALYNEGEMALVMGKMQKLFREFTKWHMKLYNAASFGCNLRELLYISEEMTENFLYIADMSFKVLAHGHMGIMMEMSATWNYQAAHGYLPVKVMKGLIEDGEFEQLNGYRMADHTYSKNFYTPFLTKNIFYNNRPQAHLFIVNSVKRPCYRDIAVGQLLGEFIEQHFYLLAEYKLNRISNNFEAFYVDVLRGSSTEEVTIQKQLSLEGWSIHDTYCVAVADIHGREEGFQRTVMYHVESETQLRCFVYESNMVILQHGEDRTEKGLEAYLRKISRSYSLEICLGNPFRGFLNLKTQFETIRHTMGIVSTMGFSNGFYRVTDHSLYYWIDRISRTPELMALCGKEAMQLRAFDGENNTDYFDTYFAWLKNDRNVVHTAKALHIHRNTLMYRLDRIQTIVPQEDTPEQKLKMLLSMMILDYQEKQKS